MTRLLVVPSSSGGWDVRNGAGAPLSHHASAEEAERAALQLLAEMKGDGEVVTQGRPVAQAKAS